MSQTFQVLTTGKRENFQDSKVFKSKIDALMAYNTQLLNCAKICLTPIDWDFTVQLVEHTVGKDAQILKTFKCSTENI